MKEGGVVEKMAPEPDEGFDVWEWGRVHKWEYILAFTKLYIHLKTSLQESAETAVMWLPSMLSPLRAG